MVFARAKNPKQNVLEGKMLELADDHETRQVFVEKKMLPADFVGNNVVLQVYQDIDCRCCLKKYVSCWVLFAYTSLLPVLL
jgi:hypothetical protein